MDAVGGRWRAVERSKASRSEKRTADPEAEVVDPVGGGVPEALGGAEVLWIAAPRSAADDTGVATASRPSCTIQWRPLIVVVIAVLDPLPNITVHIENAESVGRFLANRMYTVVGIPAVPGIFVQFRFVIPEGIT